jgi:hypothetical protein
VRHAQPDKAQTILEEIQQINHEFQHVMEEPNTFLLAREFDHCENNLLTSNLNQVCVCVQTNILNAEFK